MKFFIVLAVLATAASALPLHGGIVNTGHSQVSRHDDGHGNYEFGYNEDHATGGTFRKESGTGGHGVQGSYGLRDHDGRVRVVNYVADALGFRASVSTNEPGTDVKQDPAAVNLNYGGGHGGIPAPIAPLAIAHAEPILAQPLIAHGGASLGYGAEAGLALGGHGGYGALVEPHGVAFPSSYSSHIQHASVLSAPVLAHGGALLDGGLHGGYGGAY
ncbi:PREDICTED: adult-specific rigid cuticular protein 15.5-like [Rhagoletis zephyria]|uniref:adult-specific rigid cuticular protein 15.5-like n=1 Tax=Rhagoletis zephyria TaxID=28612 RepID=UPI00081197CC|nr:PREDICTED: adult-specific rigid cuticular protein 15.5-like [Rhagoletis zephyria]